MKTLYRNLLKFLLISSIFLSLTNNIYAVDPTFTLNPSTGYVKVGDEFTVDIMINAPEGDIVLARAAISFDESIVKVVKAERNEEIFCQWPSDEQSVDNNNGFLMLTGFCQSGEDALYQTQGGADVFGRITFEVIKAGDFELSWEYTGQDVPKKSAIVEDGSPAQNVLDTKPTDATFTAAAGDGTYVPTKPTTGTTSPRTGIWDTSSIIAGVGVFLGSIMIFAGGAILVKLNRRYVKNKYKTLVTYD